MKGILKVHKKCFLLFFILIGISFLFGCNGVTPTSYTITATAGAGGSISPVGSITVTEGDSQSFTITPDEGYQIENVLVDGASIGPVSTYSFTSVTQDHTIQTSFVLDVIEFKVYNIDTGVGYNSIQEAIDAANNGDTIEVSEGIYYENIIFDGRDINVNSTDPSNSSIMLATIIDGGGNDSVVKFTGNDYSNMTGFTIQNGNASEGGGIYIDKSNPTITGNFIKRNKADLGGGIYMSKSGPNIFSNSIINNTANQGGGFYISRGAEYGGYPRITGNDIKFNTANYYGGMFIREDNISSPFDIGGSNPSDTDEFNTICGNEPDQILSVHSLSYPNNYISSYCAIVKCSKEEKSF